MFGLGTIMNVAGVIIGGILGMFVGKFISESLQTTLMRVCGVSVIVLGLAGALEKMLSLGSDGHLTSGGSMILIISLALGGVIGELCHIEDGVERLGNWLKKKTGSAKDKSFVEGFVMTSLTVCIGAMAVVGSIEDGIFGDYTILFAKAILDLIIVLVMASSLGKGCVFAALPILVFQGVITIVAHFAGNFIDTDSLNNLFMVGSCLIFCVGINLIWPKKIKAANLLPALVIAVIMAKLGYIV